MIRRLIVLVAVLVVLAATAVQIRTRPANTDEEIASKRAHLATVLATLESEPVDHLSREQQARRRAVLDHLRAYAERGVFPHNTDLPGYRLPYLIDAYGTRCALAYAIDESGDGALLRDLAARDNHAYVSQLVQDRGLNAWLERNGLSIDDAAFIQVPGMAPPGQNLSMEGSPRDTGEDEASAPEPEPEPEAEPEAGDDPDAGSGSGAPAAPPPAGGDSASGPRRGRGSFDFGSWEIYWRANRDAYLSLRERYHADKLTSRTPWVPTSRSRRPSAKDIRDKLLPLFGRVGEERGSIGGHAIMSALIATAQPADAPPVLEAARGYLVDPDNPYREFLLLGLGQTRHADAVALLVDIAGDAREGRGALGRRTRIPERYRAFAAVGLGATASTSAATALRELLERLDGRFEDLRAASVTSLGILFPHAAAAEREACLRLLLGELKRERWPHGALAAIPAALLRSGDAEARADVLRRVARFRGERGVRSSAALALGTFGREIEEDVLDALTAAARRDPDLQTRRHAAIAVGELVVRDTREEVPAEIRVKLRRFYLGTLDGHFKQPGAMEWHYLSAGLFARRFPDDAARVRELLAREAARSKHRDERAAAVLALGLAGDVSMRGPMRELFRSSKDVQLRGAAAEALGMLGDTASRPELMALATGSTSDDLGYRSALALGYLADATVVPNLVETLEQTRSEPIRAALTRVLGQLGDERAIADLTRIASDKNASRPVRERALSALGFLARESDDSWTLPIRRGANIAQSPPALRLLLFLF